MLSDYVTTTGDMSILQRGLPSAEVRVSFSLSRSADQRASGGACVVGDQPDGPSDESVY